MLLQLNLIIPLLFVWASGHKNNTQNELAVRAPSGTYIGLINGTTPNVRQFRSIPYAAPPVGERRWLPPAKPKSDSSVIYDATQFPLSCPQFVGKPRSIFTEDVPGWLIYTDGQNSTAGESAKETSEDCLQLGVWTPTGQPKKLPVVMFVTGGSFLTGGVNIPYQLPHHWVERTGEHIVVTINYRLNILGFPNAAGLNDQNLGILDQRLALEWVRDNIEAFGGDPEKITLWGQSAGAASVDFHNFAFTEDPIVTGFYASSGTVLLGLTVADATHSNFSFVASHFGCLGSPTEELSCMRKVPFADLQNFYGTYKDNSTLVNPSQPALDFYPIPDNKIVFENYTERYALGAYSKLPIVYSTTSNEGAVTGGLLGPFPPTNQTYNDEITRWLFLCPAARTTIERAKDPQVVTYRVEFAGNFSDVSPRPYLGAYHDTDLAMLFGTHEDFPGEGTVFEFEVAHSMQDHFLAFMKDPVSGPKQLGWQTAAADQILRYGLNDNVVEAKRILDIDGVCAQA